MLLCAVHCGTALCGTGFTVGWLLMPMLRFNYIWISCYSASVLPKTTMNGDGIEYADDDILPVRRLIRIRAPYSCCILHSIHRVHGGCRWNTNSKHLCKRP